uniref:50S ribosomal protein L25 n=1 Tax=Fundidesulfovibrio putealis TaxID=270496 RepID=A0A7C4EJQ7_9BACT
MTIEKDGKTETRPALIWVVQPHPFKNQYDHVDFYGVDPSKPLHIHVKVEVTGKAKGVVVGGKLEIYRDTLEVVCLPADIPAKIVIDVTELGLNQHVQVKDVQMPQGVKAVYDSNFAVVAVLAPEAEPETPGGK